MPIIIVLKMEESGINWVSRISEMGLKKYLPTLRIRRVTTLHKLGWFTPYTGAVLSCFKKIVHNFTQRIRSVMLCNFCLHNLT